MTSTAVHPQRQSADPECKRTIAIHCREACKTFDEPIKGSRRWNNWFLGEHRKIKAVDRVSFDVYRGEVFGLLGPNGSGKSTLIRLLSTLLVPDSGEIRIFDYDLKDHPYEIRRFINRVSVEASFFKKLSAMENLRYAARLYGLPKEEWQAKATRILRRLGINEEKSLTSLENLSRGMQQKVAIARALMTSPTLILLDEPTTGLDPKSKRDVQEYVEEVMASHDATIILTTHDMDEAERLCDRIAIIADGKIVALDTAEALKKQADVNTLEEAFFQYTGKSWEDVLADENHE